MIFDRFRNFEKLRKQKLSLRKDVFLEALQDPKSMLVIVDPDQKGWREAVTAVETYGRKSGVHCTIIYVDQREDRKLPLPVLSANIISEDTFLKDGSPISPICQGRFDVLVSLATGSSYPLQYIVAQTEAKVRIGREALTTAVFDIIVGAPDGREKKAEQDGRDKKTEQPTGPAEPGQAAEPGQVAEAGQAEAFAAILTYMQKLICKR